MTSSKMAKASVTKLPDSLGLPDVTGWCRIRLFCSFIGWVCSCGGLGTLAVVIAVEVIGRLLFIYTGICRSRWMSFERLDIIRFCAEVDLTFHTERDFCELC